MNTRFSALNNTLSPCDMDTIGGIPVIFRPANNDLSKSWLGFEPSTRVLPKGWRKDPERRALPEDIVFEKDMAIPMRDGIIIRADVFRPPSTRVDHRVPALLAWSPYGKEGNGAYYHSNTVPWTSWVSTY